MKYIIILLLLAAPLSSKAQSNDTAGIHLKNALNGNIGASVAFGLSALCFTESAKKTREENKVNLFRIDILNSK